MDAPRPASPTAKRQAPLGNVRLTGIVRGRILAEGRGVNGLLGRVTTPATDDGRAAPSVFRGREGPACGCGNPRRFPQISVKPPRVSPAAASPLLCLFGVGYSLSGPEAAHEVCPSGGLLHVKEKLWSLSLHVKDATPHEQVLPASFSELWQYVSFLAGAP